MSRSRVGAAEVLVALVAVVLLTGVTYCGVQLGAWALAPPDAEAPPADRPEAPPLNSGAGRR